MNDKQGHIYMYTYGDERFRKLGQSARGAILRVREQNTQPLWFAKVKRCRQAEAMLFDRLKDKRVDRIVCDVEDIVIFVRHNTTDIVFQSADRLPNDWAKGSRQIEWFRFDEKEQVCVVDFSFFFFFFRFYIIRKFTFPCFAGTCRRCKRGHPLG
jgi:hypothetical protein